METIVERNVVYGTADAEKSAASAVSWGAIFAGGVTAAALSLILFILGIGLGLTSISPWSQEGISGQAFGISAILWITLTSLAASALGGYLTGRLRTRWLSVHTDEVYFRDTAHGFLAWGLATLLTAALFTTTSAALITGGVKAGAAVAGGVAQTAVAATGAAAAGAGAMADNEAGPLAYFTDSLFRREPGGTLPARQITPPIGTPAPAQPANAPGITQEEQVQAADAARGQANPDLNPEQQAALSAGGASAETMVVPQTAAATQYRQPVTDASLAEVTRIFTRAIQKENLSQEDLAHVSSLVSQHTGLSAQEAEMRVNEVFTSFQGELREMETTARNAADEARSASAKVALWLFVSLLAGAFVGSLAATYGGKQRDL
ncbi:MAG: hypothetical protein V4628_07230 [Pseudomonadota bacterium]